jgi:hypothetical protein
MRPEESIALRWSDIDVQAGTIRVQRVRTFRGTERQGSKTHAMRDVDLVGLAPQALASMKPRTCMKRTDDGEEWNMCLSRFDPSLITPDAYATTAQERYKVGRTRGSVLIRQRPLQRISSW